MIRRVYFCTIVACMLCVSVACMAEDKAKVEVGAKAPDFTVTGIEGAEFRLSDRTSKGKNIILLFSRAHW